MLKHTLKNCMMIDFFDVVLCMKSMKRLRMLLWDRECCCCCCLKKKKKSLKGGKGGIYTLNVVGITSA